MSTKTGIISIDEIISQDLAARKNAEQPSGGKMISLKGGVIQFGGSKAEHLDCCIIDFARERTFYTGAYDPDTPASPVCFAIGRETSKPAPHPDSPEAQHLMCEGCPMDEWGSSPRGKGKACRESRRLALIPLAALDSPGTVAESDVYYLRVPVMSIANWSAYYARLEGVAKRRPQHVVTRITTVPDAKSMFRVRFDYAAELPPDVLVAVRQKIAAQADAILFPYSKPSPEPEPEPEPRRAPAKFARKRA